MSVESGSENIFLSNSPTESDQVQELICDLYPDLRQIAFSHIANEHEGHTLTPTAVVNETFIRLYKFKQLHWIDKPQFLALCSKQMRRILVDYARQRDAEKRGGGNVKITLYEESTPEDTQNIGVESVHQALEKLGAAHPELEILVELRYFGGFTNKEISKHFGVSEATVKRKWMFARAWLYKEMEQ